MRVRHKQPTLVSMWMLDVFCCALGCVTLLWLMNSRNAAEQTAAAQTALSTLNVTRSDLDTARGDRDSARSELLALRAAADALRVKLTAEVQQLTGKVTDLDAARLSLAAQLKTLNDQLAATRQEKDDTTRKLDASMTEVRSVKELLNSSRLAVATLEKKLDASTADLTATRTEKEALAKSLTEKMRSVEDLSTLAKKKEEERAAAAKMATDLQSKLDDLDGKLKIARKDEDAAKTATTKNATALAAAVKLSLDLQAKIDELDAKLKLARASEDTAKTATNKSATDLAVAAGQVKDLEKKLADARAMIIELQGEKGKIGEKFDKLQRDTENRFAGIAMTGKRVVFMIDRSGSMDRIDEQTIAPTKWPIVAESLAKVMRSMPEMEEFLVLVFSKEPQWLFGNGEWQKFDGEKTAREVKDTLLKVKAEGDTNLYSAFELAFRQRERGMDTIYLFSDGLPTSGPGLTEAMQFQQPPLRETEKSEILARHLRATLRSTWNRGFTNAPKVRINAVGFFYESPDVGAFLWALARENDGSFVGMSRP